MNSIKTYLRMLGFMKPHVLLFILSSVLSVFIVSLDGVSIWFLATLPKALFDPDTVIAVRPELSFSTINLYLKYWTHRLISAESISSQLIVVCTLIVTAFTLKNVSLFIHNIIMVALNVRIVRDIRNLVYRHVLMLPVSYYDANKSGEITALVVNDVSMINQSMTSSLNSLFMEPPRR